MKVSVNICTFKRPEGLMKLLESLAAQKFEKHPDTALVVNVVDNEPNPDTRTICEAIAQKGLDIRYLEERRRGIPNARNKGLDAVERDSDFIAMVDDDEEADPRWLDELIEAAVQTGAAAIFGTVRPILPEGAPAWMHHRFWYHRPFRGELARGEKIPSSYTPLTKGTTANLLLRSQFIWNHQLRFNTDFNNGSDTALITSLQYRGGELIYAPSAIVVETIPPHRCRLSYVLRRGFASGTIRWKIESSCRPETPTAFESRKLLAKFLRRSFKRCLRQSVKLVVMVCTLKAGKGKAIESVYDLAFHAGQFFGAVGFRVRLYRG